MLSWLEFFAEHWNTPAGLLAVLLVGVIILQLIGKVLGHIGKNVPKIMKINEWLKKRKQKEDELTSVLETIPEMQKKLDKTYNIASSTWLNEHRNTVLNFASRLAKEDKDVSHEEFRHVMSVYEEYEDMLKEQGKSNGQVDIAYRVITEDYKRRLENREFLEDMRGY